MANMLDRDNQHLLLEKTDNTNNSFIANINKLAAKLNVIVEAVGLFDENVIPILEEIAELDLGAAIEDLEKGSYLGNRKIDINLALNVEGIDGKLIDKDPDAAEAIWTDPSKTVLYDKATCTFVDGTVIELPFMFDGNPVTVSTHADLLTQFLRLDYIYAQSQVDSIYQFTVLSNENYVLTIDNVPYTFTSGVGATRESVIAGIANMINSTSIPITANVTETNLALTADVAGNPFYLTVSSNMQSTTITANVIEGPRETKFLAKLDATLSSSFAAPVVGEFIRFFDVIGDNSNLERIQLHAVSGSYKEENPTYFWAKTTSAFQTLAMRAGDVIKLGNGIDKLILLANSIEEVKALQERIPQLVDNYDVNGNPLGETTVYNSLDELMEIHSSLNALLAIYDDIRATGNQYIFTVGEDLQLVNSPIKEVATNLQTTNTVGLVGTHIGNVNTVAANITNVNTTATDIVNVNTVATNIANVNLTGASILDVNTVSSSITKVNNVNDNIVPIVKVADSIVPHLNEILQADTNAALAVTKAQEASASALLATQKNNEIKNVSVGSTITGAAGTLASVVYNPANGKFTFVVPQGVKGDRGEAFQVNSIGTLAQRALYNNQLTGFSYLAVDVDVNGSTIPHIYFKLSNASGDWSVGAPFGRGDKGNTGDTGNGITQVTFTNTTHVSGLAGQSGGVDTYTITYTDGTTDTFIVHNGIDSDFNSTSVSTLTNKTLDSMTNTIGANHVHFKVRNSTGTTILKGTVVKASSTQTGTDYIEVVPTTSSTDTGLGITTSDISVSTDWVGLIIAKGEVNNINTSMWNVGTKLYTSNGGTFTNIKPTTNTYQVSGYVHKKHSTLGTIVVDFSEPIDNVGTISDFEGALA